jgi:DNA-binding helix-turn-helix protein
MKRGEYILNLDLGKLKIAMAKECLSVNDLVEKTGLGRATVSKVINGRQKPTTKTIGLMAKALNVGVSEIISTKE